MRKIILTLAAAGLAIPAAPALADSQQWGSSYGRYNDNDRYDRRYENRRGYDRRYDDRGRYNEPRRLSRRDRVWQGDDGRYHCQRENGTTGLIIGGAGGALLGREIDGGRDRTLGTILGAAAGALLGREIDRGGASCR